MSKVITEQMKELARRLVPAIRHKETGEISTGKRGDYHSHLLLKKYPKHSFVGSLDPQSLEIMRQHDRGFYDTKTKSFLTRDEASDHAGVLDSQDLVPHKHVGGKSRVAMFREEVKKKIRKIKKQKSL